MTTDENKNHRKKIDWSSALVTADEFPSLLKDDNDITPSSNQPKGPDSNLEDTAQKAYKTFKEAGHRAKKRRAKANFGNFLD